MDFPLTATTPPPTTVPELQSRTFKLLKRNSIRPIIDEDIKFELVTCSGVKDTTARTSASNFSAGKIQLGLARCLTTVPPPSFLSVTLTDSESASITLEKRLITHFYNNGEELLLGHDGPEQVPITFDLKDLPLESTGIVCGVASRLTDGMKGRIGDVFNMSYLSTAKAGHVIVYRDELEEAMEALKGVEQNGIGEH
jgi:cellobiose dehydrogenase (acceptor)